MGPCAPPSQTCRSPHGSTTPPTPPPRRSPRSENFGTGTPSSPREASPRTTAARASARSRSKWGPARRRCRLVYGIAINASPSFRHARLRRCDSSQSAFSATTAIRVLDTISTGMPGRGPVDADPRSLARVVARSGTLGCSPAWGARRSCTSSSFPLLAC